MSREGGAAGAKKAPEKRIHALDAIRFVASLWVVLAHTGLPLPDSLQGPGKTAQLVRGLSVSLFDGPAAVIVFFVISGMVIHSPYCAGRPVPLGSFYTRRLLRIGVPLLAAIALSRLLQSRQHLDAVLWSLYAEMIYYALYPLLMQARLRFGWPLTLGASTLAYALTIVLFPGWVGYSGFPVHLAWIVGLPCWLLGCLLAERRRDGALGQTSERGIWAYRLSIWALSSAAVLLNFHGDLLPLVHHIIPYPWTLNPFAILVFLWLEREIARYNQGTLRPYRALEWAGAFSYSLYLTHMMSLQVWARFAGSSPFLWPLKLGFILGAAYLFYRLVEQPSHQLVQRLQGARFLRGWSVSVSDRAAPAAD